MAQETATRTRDEHYDVVSVLYHMLQEGDTVDRYIADAQEAGDDELVQFFREVQQVDRERAQRAKQLLKARL
ncbi:hypothetical protein NI17_019980 [Thermobifida halotolerans]|uniref:Uncharacterized protein n=1 Tax=Thermobifida halotolerans TaxID=483545 RepID=A0A399FWK3_9ACTN|nr:hypothetical protein [Thermobifida halotolerans]UOE19014.1 hypothetical protein NI17_019980 [Thermobifida halotolerans]